jgi:hypothetical protein
VAAEQKYDSDPAFAEHVERTRGCLRALAAALEQHALSLSSGDNRPAATGRTGKRPS